MKEALKRIKADVILSALLCIALGVVLIVWSAETIKIMCWALAAGLVIIGVINIISYFRDKRMHMFSGVLGLIVLLIGIWLFMRPDSVVSLIPIVIGVILAVHGIQDVKLAIETKRNGYEKWWSILLMGIVSLVLGVLCVVYAFGLVTLALKFIGVALIYDGLSDLWIVSRASKAAKQKKLEEEALEAEYKEVETAEEEKE